MKKILSLLLLFFLLIPVVSAIEETKVKTVPLFGVIDTWIIYRQSRSNDMYVCLYGGFDGSNITLLLQDQNGGGTPPVPVKYPYTLGMDIVLPRIVLGDIIVSENGITYSETPNLDKDPNVRDETQGTIPGFELPIFVGALIICGIIIRIKKFDVRKKKL